MKKIVLVMIGLLLSFTALAELNKSVAWNAPTQRVNGDALLAGEIASYDLECSFVSGGVVYSTQLPPTPRTHVTPEVFGTGNFACRMRTNDTGGLQSIWSDPVVFTVGRCDVSDCRPLPPQSISVDLP